MMKHNTLKDHRTEKRQHSKRCIYALVFITIIIMAVIVRLFVLQVIDHPMYATLSRKNIVNIVPIAPQRGLIFDRNGILLAKNNLSYTLTITPSDDANLAQTLDLLKSVVQLKPTDIQSFMLHKKYYHSDQAIPLMYKLNEQQLAEYYVNRFRLAGVEVSTDMVRYYPLQANDEEVVGYTGRINANEQTQLDASNYQATHIIGKTGAEKQYQDILHGTTGYKEVEIDATGKDLRTLSIHPAIAGDDIHLTIDSRLQKIASKAFGKEKGALVAIDPNNGDILTMVSMPDYNPNDFSTGISQKQYNHLLKQPGKPLFDRVLHGQYAIGSTIKPFLAVFGLDLGYITPNTWIYDNGTFQLPHTKHIFHDWKKHGWVNVHKAIVVSCDTFFYQLAVQMGISEVDNILHTFGFGKKTNIDLPSEKSGLVPSPAWKKAKLGEPWYQGDTVITGIGQGFLLADPLQLALATAVLANRGLTHQPHVLLAKNSNIDFNWPQQQVAQLKNKNNWHIVIKAMQDVIRSPMGTGEHFGRHPAYSVAAKTGTSQLFGRRDEDSNEYNLPKRLRNNHLFICFAPVNHPRIAVAIIVEHAALAPQIARIYLDNFFKLYPHENTYAVIKKY